jgi:hypothetical protein
LKAAQAVALPRSTVLAQHPPQGWNSVIVSDFLEIFAEFLGQCFLLLWRGGRDRFHPRDFHTNTVTVILDTQWNLSGGFTPVEWESPRSEKLEGHDRLESEKFRFHVEESAQRRCAKICVGPPKEGPGNLLLLQLRSNLSWWH